MSTGATVGTLLKRRRIARNDWLVGLALAGIALVGLIQRLRRAWEDMPALVRHTVPDDSFYYFQIARNIMHGKNATLDGETVTNGFHPLWMGIILPMFTVDDRHLSMHFALTLGAILGTATILLVFDVTRRLTDNPRAALLTAGFFALHPVFVVYAVNGLETSIMMCMLALITTLFVRAARMEDRTNVTYAVLGFVCGLLVLSRIDTVLVLPAVAGWFAFAERRGEWWRAPALIGGVAALVVAPWLIWNLVTFGTIVQDSALAGNVFLREEFLRNHGDSLIVHIKHGISETRRYLVDRFPHEFLVPYRDSAKPFLLACVALVIAVLTLPTRYRRQTLISAGYLAVPFGALAATLLYETGIRWFVRPWYFAPYAVVATISVGLIANWLEGIVLDVTAGLSRRRESSHSESRPTFAMSLAFGLLYAVLAGGLLYVYGPQRDDGLVYGYPWQPDVLTATTWLEQNTQTADRIGAYNAGIPSYLSERTVVNLDGVVNRDAYKAAKACTTRDYLREMDIDLVADTAGQFIYAACSFDMQADFDEIAVIGGANAVHILRPKP